MSNPAREKELYEDLAAILSDESLAPHLIRLMRAASHQEPELYAAWQRFTRATANHDRAWLRH